MKDHKEALNNIMENVKNEMLWRLENEYQRGYDEGLARGTENGYTRGYENGKKIHEEVRDKDMGYGYEKGLADAWECAKKAWSMSETEFHKIFNIEWDFEYMLDNLSATEVVQKIKDYEERQTEEIKVGDEVTIRDIKGTIINLDEYGLAQIMCVDGFVCFRVEDLTKTGRHFPQIAEVLEQMRKESHD